MGEAVEHAATAGKARDREAVILLVEEEAGLLAVLHVHAVIDAVLADLRHGAHGHVPALEREPALPLLHALKGADGRVVALENAVDHNAVLGEDLDEQREKHLLDALHPRVTALDPAGPLGGDGEAGIGSFCFHGVTCLPDILGKL